MSSSNTNRPFNSRHISQIFKYRNMAITPEDFTPEQTQAFNQAVTEYKEENKKYIDIVSNW